MPIRVFCFTSKSLFRPLIFFFDPNPNLSVCFSVHVWNACPFFFFGRSPHAFTCISSECLGVEVFIIFHHRTVPPPFCFHATTPSFCLAAVPGVDLFPARRSPPCSAGCSWGWPTFSSRTSLSPRTASSLRGRCLTTTATVPPYCAGKGASGRTTSGPNFPRFSWLVSWLPGIFFFRIFLWICFSESGRLSVPVFLPYAKFPDLSFSFLFFLFSFCKKTRKKCLILPSRKMRRRFRPKYMQYTNSKL